MSEKLCMFCKHFDFESIGYTYYSPETGGDSYGGMTCRKNHYCEFRPNDTDEFRKTLLKAEKCPDYTLPER